MVRSTPNTAKPRITEKSVRTYLAKHPDFFTRRKNHDLLRELSIPHLRPHKLSLLEYQIRIFREDNDQLHNQLHNLIEVNSMNQEVLNRFFSFIQEMIELQHVPDLISHFVATWKDTFSVHGISFLFPKDSLIATTVAQQFPTPRPFTLLPSTDTLPKSLQKARSTNTVVCAKLSSLSRKYFADTLKNGSYIFIPSGTHANQCGIFLGSNDASRFTSEMRSDLVQFVCNIFTILLYAHMHTDSSQPELHPVRQPGKQPASFSTSTAKTLDTQAHDDN